MSRIKENAILGDIEMNGWILCNERMPETPNPGVDGLWESNPVLVYGEAECGDDGYAYDVAIYIKDEETNEGDWGEAADYGTNYLKKVIAWREIPKFTEEVQQDE